jgi:hypothetical protein
LDQTVSGICAVASVVADIPNQRWRQGHLKVGQHVISEDRKAERKNDKSFTLPERRPSGAQFLATSRHPVKAKENREVLQISDYVNV